MTYINGDNIITELERLAAACPYDSVDIWVRREPEGKYCFIAFANHRIDTGTSDCGHGETPAKAVDDLLKDINQGLDREPEVVRQRKIAELQAQIAKLQALEIPKIAPYKPTKLLGNGERPAIPVNEDINV